MLVHPDDLKTIKKLELKQPFVWLATWFGSGFLRAAPGTWGSLASIPPALIVYNLWEEVGFIAGIIIITITGYWSAGQFDKATGGHDNKMIVIDEAAGQWIVLLPVLIFKGLNPFWIFSAFLLFRLLDITKPWPVSWFDKKLTGPVSVMGDDIVAGLIAAICLMGVYYAGLG